MKLSGDRRAFNTDCLEAFNDDSIAAIQTGEYLCEDRVVVAQLYLSSRRNVVGSQYEHERPLRPSLDR